MYLLTENQKILSAMPSWLKLSSPDQKAVNTELKNKVGKTYQKLVNVFYGQLLWMAPSK